MSTVRLVVGLGNPGADYERTRHNAGFWFVDELARSAGCSLRAEARFQAEVGRCSLHGQDCRLQKPTTFMNRSGQAVAALANFLRIPPLEILVVHDDLDLPPGVARLKKGGGHGGHNGLRDLVAHLGTREFHRLRIGIGHPGDHSQVVDYVLHRPSREEQELIDAAMARALEVMPLVVAGEFERAMHKLHTT
ncbi:MAG: aminoacyl-tRNA hydrolase [Thiohalobacteraceae bacterium]|nr:aminoacyl-tRNA hydrolase [Gammaproteobacteria bacterium]